MEISSKCGGTVSYQCNVTKEKKTCLQSHQRCSPWRNACGSYPGWGSAGRSIRVDVWVLLACAEAGLCNAAGVSVVGDANRCEAVGGFKALTTQRTWILPRNSPTRPPARRRLHAAQHGIPVFSRMCRCDAWLTCDEEVGFDAELRRGLGGVRGVRSRQGGGVVRLATCPNQICRASGH